MRTINLIVIHCSATREDKDFTEYDLDVCHRRRGFNGAGYHFYIRKNGEDYRFEVAPNPVPELRDRTKDNMCVGRQPLCRNRY